MKIHSNGFALFKSYQQTSTKPVDTNKTSKNQSADQLEISREAQEILKQTVENQSVNQAKLEKLKNQIADGTYQMDTEQIAERLISQWKKGSIQ